MPTAQGREGERGLSLEEARGCGMGQGENCCAYLTAGMTNSTFDCAQRTTIADFLYAKAKAGQSTARRTPESDFPACQQEGRLEPA